MPIIDLLLHGSVETIIRSLNRGVNFKMIVDMVKLWCHLELFSLITL